MPTQAGLNTLKITQADSGLFELLCKSRSSFDIFKNVELVFVKKKF